MSVKRTMAPGSGDAGAAVSLACADSAPGNIEKTAIAVLNIVFTSLCFGWVEVKLTVSYRSTCAKFATPIVWGFAPVQDHLTED